MIHPAPRRAIIVVAAGSGTRLAAGAPKAFVGLGAHTILRHALDGVFHAPEAQVVVVAPADRVGEAETDARLAAGDRSDLVTVVAGGATRQQSVAAGLAALWGDVEVVLVHDAARALTPPEVFARVFAAVDETGWGIVPVLPVIDTIKRVDGPHITGGVDRAELAAAQTPQGFRRDILTQAYALADRDHTDDAAVVAQAGHQVGVVDGDAASFKITTPEDLARAEHLLRGEPGPVATDLPRIGLGTDVHAFGGDGELWLGGIAWPGEQALAGHSDGDAVAHAIVDALLGAAGLGDIGTHFGTSHPEYAGAHADVFLARTRALIGEAGWRVGNVSVQVQANRPRIGARRAEAETALSAALGGAPVTLSATTTDGLGFPGRGEGVQAIAVALIVPARF